MRDKINKLGYVPAPLAKALGAIEGAIAQRKADARDGFVNALRETMNAGGSSAQLAKKLIGCALPLQKAKIAWAQLGEDLNRQHVAQWIETALRDVDVRTLDNARASLNAPEGQMLLDQLSGIKKPTDVQHLTSLYAGLLSQHLDDLMRGSQTHRDE